jgi:hypothetical protein
MFVRLGNVINLKLMIWAFDTFDQSSFKSCSDSIHMLIRFFVRPTQLNDQLHHWHNLLVQYDRFISKTKYQG